MPVSDRVKKLTSMVKCRCRLKRVKRRNRRFVIGFGQRPVRLPLVAGQIQPDQPGQRVEHGEGQRADQQDGHEPEGPEKPWVTVGIVVRGVGQVTCEAPDWTLRGTRRKFPPRCCDPGPNRDSKSAGCCGSRDSRSTWRHRPIRGERPCRGRCRRRSRLPPRGTCHTDPSW